MNTPSQTNAATSTRIGDYFVQRGRLTPSDIDAIAQLQESSGLRFGDAAVQLGLLDATEVQQALSEQYHYPTAPANIKLQPFAIASQANSSEAEAIRRLRTNIQLQQKLVNAYAIAVVGARGNEKTTYVATSLAIAFAQTGLSVLLINANLRQPSNKGLYNGRRAKGLSTVLSKRDSLNNCLNKDEFPNLSVLDAGPLPPNPAELLTAPTFQAVLNDAQAHFDVVLIDTPASALYPDAVLIGQQANACLLVARQHSSLLNDVRETRNSLEANGARLLGIVYNAQTEKALSERRLRLTATR